MTMKLVDADQLEADLTSVADKIRTKTGSEEKLAFPSGYESALDSIESADSALAEVEYAMTNGYTDYSYMFYQLDQMTEVPMGILQHIPNGTDCRYLFAQSNIVEIPDLDLQNATIVSDFANNCANLERVGILNTPNAEYLGAMFLNCNKLHTISGIDVSATKEWSAQGIFKLCSALENLTINGIVKVGFADFSYCPLLTHDSLMSVVNALVDRYSLGWSTTSMTFGTTNLAKLTDAEIAIATQKGWTLQ